MLMLFVAFIIHIVKLTILTIRVSISVINIILVEVPSRSSTQVQLVNRLNHDDTYEVGGNVGWSTQIGNFQALVKLEARPNYENRDNREVRVTPEGELLGTLFEENISQGYLFTLLYTNTIVDVLVYSVLDPAFRKFIRNLLPCMKPVVANKSNVLRMKDRKATKIEEIDRAKR